MKKQLTAVMLLLGVIFGASIQADADGGGKREKVTICHAAGRDGTTKYVTITVGYQAAFGPAGHFYENGTPRAGHEDDYLGACKPPPTTTTEPPPVTTLPPPPPPTLPPTTLPPETTVPPVTTLPPVTTEPPLTTLPPLPPVTTQPPCVGICGPATVVPPTTAAPTTTVVLYPPPTDPPVTTEVPPTVPPTVPPGPTPELPSTGVSNALLVWIAAALLLGGLFSVRIARRMN